MPEPTMNKPTMGPQINGPGQQSEPVQTVVPDYFNIMQPAPSFDPETKTYEWLGQPEAEPKRPDTKDTIFKRPETAPAPEQETTAVPWKDVFNNPEYQAQDWSEQGKIKLDYFDNVVAPNIPDNEYELRKGEFLNYAARLENDKDTPKFFEDVIMATIAKAPFRAAGVALGFFAGIPSASIAPFYERAINKEAFDAEPLWNQLLISVGAGLTDWARSTFEEGYWGVRYGDYYKAETGKTIEESLPTGLKWAAPTLEFLAELPFDPLIIEGSVANIISRGVPKEFIGMLPKNVVADLNRLQEISNLEKKFVEQRLVDILERRRTYPQWWENEIRAGRADKWNKGTPLSKEGERTAPSLTAPQNAMAGQPGRALANVVPDEVPQLSKEIEELKVLGKLPSVTSGKTYAAISKLEEFRRHNKLGPLSRFDPAKQAELKQIQTIEKLNGFRKKNNIPIIELKATGGLVAGVGEDENGNITYDPIRGMAGGLLLAGGLSLGNMGKAKRLTETLANNPAWAKIHGSMGAEAKAFSFAGILSRLNVNLLDRIAVIDKFSPKTYAAARVIAAYKDQAMFKFNELKTMLRPVSDQEVQVSDYIAARRMETRANLGLENPGGVTKADAISAQREILKHADDWGKDSQAIVKAAEDFNQWTHDNILKELLDSGVISKEGYAAIKKNNNFYATFDVLDYLPDDLQKVPGLPSKEFFSVGGQKVIQKMTGTTKQIADPLEATIKKFMETQALIARNKVANTLIDDPGMATIFRRVASSKEEYAILNNMKANPIVEGGWNPKEFGTVNRMKDGRVERYLVPIELADAMKQISPYQAPRIVHALNAIFRKSATTLYLPFTISNAFRDALMAYTTAPVYKAKDAPKFLKDWGQGFWEGLKHEFAGKSDLATEYIKSGGSFGFTGELNKATAAKKALFDKTLAGKAWTVIKSPADFIEKASATVELAPRLAVYKRAKITGYAMDDAALVAKASTIDFNRGGVYTKVINQFVPFLNARVQGRLVLAEALKNNPKDTLAKVFASTVIPGMGAYAWNRLYFSDYYDDIPEYIRQNYFPIITGISTDDQGRDAPQYIVIPKGDVGQVSWNPLEFALDSMWGKDQQGTAAFLINYLSDLSPVEFARNGKVSVSKAAGSLSPPIAKGFLEDWANLKFYQGGEVVPYYMGKSKPPELQYKENTPETYKWIADKLKDVPLVPEMFKSPLRLQNFASNVLAGYGREGLSPEAMVRGLTGRLVKTKGGEIEQQAWTAVRDIEYGYISARAYAQELIKEGDLQGAMGLMQQWNAGLLDQVDEFNERFGGHGITEKGGITKSYSFTRRKAAALVKSARRNAADKRTPLEKKLSSK